MARAVGTVGVLAAVLSIVAMPVPMAVADGSQTGKSVVSVLLLIIIRSTDRITFFGGSTVVARRPDPREGTMQEGEWGDVNQAENIILIKTH